MEELRKEVIAMIDCLDREQLMELHRFLDQLQDQSESPGHELEQDQREQTPAQ